MGKKKVSFSQYKLWKKCPLAYKFQYIDKIGEFKKNIHLVFGTAMHDTIQSLLYVLYNRNSISERDTVNKIKVSDYLIKRNNKIVDFDTNRLLKERMYHEVQKIDEEVREDRVTKEELIEFYEDGIQIINYLKTHRKEWFKLRNWELVDIEYKLSKDLPENVEFVGYIDILLKDDLGNYHIIDLKTSTKGWGYYQKNDTVSTNQNLLYKQWLSEEMDIPMKRINVEYLVLKRKVTNVPNVPDESRLQRFTPSNGIISVKKAVSDFEIFISSVFKDGKRDETKDYPANPTKFNCNYCEFSDKGVCEYVHKDAK